jgi:hypothetical protein
MDNVISLTGGFGHRSTQRRRTSRQCTPTVPLTWNLLLCMHLRVEPSLRRCCLAPLRVLPFLRATLSCQKQTTRLSTTRLTRSVIIRVFWCNVRCERMSWAFVLVLHAFFSIHFAMRSRKLDEFLSLACPVRSFGLHGGSHRIPLHAGLQGLCAVAV